jgi:hypothetical protein
MKGAKVAALMEESDSKIKFDDKKYSDYKKNT